jgi:hypothetical protein
MAVLRDASGEVVQKLSRDLPLKGPAAQAAQVKQGNFIYKEHFTAPPGRYTLETAVMDREANKMGTKKASLVVAPKQPGVSMSNVVLVRRYQPKATDMEPDEDFAFKAAALLRRWAAPSRPARESCWPCSSSCIPIPRSPRNRN